MRVLVFPVSSSFSSLSDQMTRRCQRPRFDYRVRASCYVRVLVLFYRVRASCYVRVLVLFVRVLVLFRLVFLLL